MRTYKSLLASALVLGVILILAIPACQKFSRPELVIIPDPLPPTYNALKSYWQFENNTTDEGESKLKSTAVNLTYSAGISGQALKVGAGGYLLLKAIGDTVKQPNEFVTLPADTLRNLGSFSLAFWMNGPGPGTTGAQGLFSISNKSEFWGNLDLFLENWENVADPSEAYLKIHMYNAGVATGNGEEWNELKIPKVFNKWTHIAVTYDGNSSEFTLYVDGVPTSINKKKLGGGSYGKIKFNNFNGMVLGSYQFQTTPTLTNHGPETWARSFNGLLDQFRLYNKALTPAEITDLFSTKK